MNSILITGGTGSLGRVLAAHCPHERICIYSRDEYKQAEMRTTFSGFRYRWFIGDVRDRERLRRAFEGVQEVIHCAALKRVEVGTYDAAEMVKTNVLGTLNVIEAAHDARVTKVLAISSDKACAPVSAYGASKLLMEKVILAANNARGVGGPRFAAVRLGNFAGSRGSVIPAWRSGNITMTDPECTRFWITASDAARLILDTLGNMGGGELISPSLRAFRLGDLAMAMNVRPPCTGLGPEERLHEYMGDLSSEHAPRMSVAELRAALMAL